MATENRQINHPVATGASLDSGAHQGLFGYDTTTGRCRFQFGALVANTKSLANYGDAPTAHKASHEYGGSDALVGQNIAGLRTSDSPNFTSVIASGVTRISSAGVATLTGLTSTGGATITGGKTILAAAAAGYASLNIPTRSAAVTTPATGDIQSDGFTMFLHGLGLTSIRGTGDTIGVGSSCVLVDAAAPTKGWASQLSTTNTLDFWNFNGSWSRKIQFFQDGSAAFGGSVNPFLKITTTSASGVAQFSSSGANSVAGTVGWNWGRRDDGLSGSTVGGWVLNDDTTARAWGDQTQFVVATRLKSSGRIAAWVDKTANYTATANDQYIGVSGASAFQITLPATAVIGTEYTIKRTDANAATITISAGGTTTIDAGTTTTLTTAYQVVRIVANATNKYSIV